MKISKGDRVSGRIMNQDFTGTVTLSAGGQRPYVDVKADSPVSSPIGRQMTKLIFRGEQEISTLTVLR